MHSKTFKTFDVVLVPFPFVDSGITKLRPAVILSSAAFGLKIEHHVLAMVTSAQHTPWPLDTQITNLKSAGLSKESLIRMKLFTLDERLIIQKIGSLDSNDQNNISDHLTNLLKSALNTPPKR
ncbi:MAG: hypothetical protein UW09_C0004G0003 [candidate division TM6 bacterium GW2011_GWF2_43_87]|nr:MAG: hypothetical protein UW09_C0004G0003 [candidate division TM6 bacterium GW2011_GWF2_43_87]